MPHAVSVSLPTWADVVGYEEGDARVVDALRAGYPRFVLHPAVTALAAAVPVGPGERALVWPTPAAADRAAAYVDPEARVVPFREVFAVVFPAEAYPRAKQAWQHAGEIVSSRRAEASLAIAHTATPGAPSWAGGPSRANWAGGALDTLRERVAGLAGVPAADVSLHPSGMAALAAALRRIQTLFPGRPTAQLGFPYIDTLKLQERLGAGACFYPLGTDADLDDLERRLAAGELGGVFLELPGNPLMSSPDLARVSRATRAAGVPLVVDDSAASFYHHDFTPYADLLVTSLTKNFAGQGNAMGGALVRVPGSLLYDRLGGDAEGEALFGEDGAVLLAGSRDFEARMATAAASTLALVQFLAAHPAVARVYHPSLDTPERYRQALRPHGSYGGMFSLVLQPGLAPGFYDRLAVAKGPSFGLPVTLACPYTLLAHYTELDWAERCGVPRDLIRVSVGQEPVDELLACFRQALDEA